MTYASTVNPTISPSLLPLAVGALFAVYGTLRKGCSNYKNLNLADRAEFVREDLVEGTLYHLGGFPGLTQEIQPCLADEDATPVKVEVYKVLDASLAWSLDALEGYHPQRLSQSMYIRAPITLLSGEVVDTYYYNNDQVASRASIIESGDWVNRI